MLRFFIVLICQFIPFYMIYGVPVDTLSQDFFNQNSGKYLIDREYDLCGNIIVIPPNSVLVFKKNGKISNGKIVGNNTRICSSNKVIFNKDVEFDGIFSTPVEYEWLYESSCEIVKKTVMVYGEQYIVKTAEGLNQWVNMIDVFRRISGHFYVLHFNKSYVLNNPQGTEQTRSNVLRINERVENLKICGGEFHNSGLQFTNWHHVEFSDMKIYGKYYDYDRRVINLEWDELTEENGQQLNYCGVGLQLSSQENSDAINTSAVICDVETDGCYNGIYVGRWSGTDNMLISVRDVVVKNCLCKNTFYHGFATVNCSDVSFNKCNAQDTYLGMLIDISHGSKNVTFANGKGKGLGTPFKIASNPEFPDNENCCIYNNIAVVDPIVKGGDQHALCLSGTKDIIMKNNVLKYKSAEGNTFLYVSYFHDTKIEFSHNKVYGLRTPVLFRINLTEHVANEENVTQFEIKNNHIQYDKMKSSVESSYFMIFDEKVVTDNTNIVFNISVEGNMVAEKRVSPKHVLYLVRPQGYDGKSFECEMYIEGNVFKTNNVVLMQNCVSNPQLKIMTDL